MLYVNLRTAPLVKFVKNFIYSVLIRERISENFNSIGEAWLTDDSPTSVLCTRHS
ncbi:mCG147932 [Mus musculus]|nr:mCG147932 [Mus musculus]